MREISKKLLFVSVVAGLCALIGMGWSAVALDVGRGTVVGASGLSEQTINAAATISVNYASGTTVRILLGSTAITTVNAAPGIAGQTLITEIIQDGTGTRSITGWSSSWSLRGGLYKPTLGANSRDIIIWSWDNTDSKWIESARIMNALPTTSASGDRLDLSLVDINVANNGGSKATNNSGSVATATNFYFTQPTDVYGCRFYWAGNVARTVRVRLWDNTAQRASTTVNTSGSGVYSAYFSSPYSAEPYVVHECSVFDTSGTDYTKIDTAALTLYVPTSLNTQTPTSPLYVGKGVWFSTINKFASNDTAIPNSSAVNERYIVEPISVSGIR